MKKNMSVENVIFKEKKEADKVRYQELSMKMNEEEKKYRAQMEELVKEHEEAMESLAIDNSKELKKMEEEANKLTEDIKNMEEENKKVRDERENMYWNEIDAMKERNKNELYKITKQGLEAKAELTLTTDKYSKSKTEKEGFEQTIKEKLDQLNTEISQQHALQGEIENQINEIAERKRTISDKETRIFQLKKKTQELEKFKFVLDYKIKELKRDIHPKEAEIAKLHEQTTKMNQEYKHFHRVNENLALIVDDLKMRQEGLQKEVQDQNTKLEQQDGYIKKFNDDLYDCMKTAGNYKELKTSIVGLHKKYVLEEVRTNKGEADLQKEYAANRQYLEKSVNYLRQQITKDATNHMQEYNRYMKENVTLLQEINDLRKEVKTLDMEYKRQRSKHGATMDSRFMPIEDQSEKAIKISDKHAKELEYQDIKIQELSDELAKLQEENATLNNRARSSRGARNLPPIKRSQEEAKEGSEEPRPKESEKRLDDFQDDEEGQKPDDTQNQEDRQEENEGDNEAEEN